MIMRERFEQQLSELRGDILHMGKLVEDELLLALRALQEMDAALAQQVYSADNVVNKARFAIEDKCFTVISTQQPTARDLRALVTVLNMIVDLERMGDQAKGIAKVIVRIHERQPSPVLPELNQMGEMVLAMLRQSMTASRTDDIALAQSVVGSDEKVDALFGQIFTQLIEKMAADNEPAKIEDSYEMVRVARELERFGDLATNIAERVIYRVTGQIGDANPAQP